MRRRRNILLMCMVLLATMCTTSLQAQVVLERFVKTSADGGSPAHGGTSWDDAIDNLQEAINSLRTSMQAGDRGVIYVAKGHYNPTESTESRNSNILHTSFLMYEGITIYGGYAGTETGNALKPENRVKKGDRNAWDFANETILTGNHSSGLETDFTFNPSRGQYNTRYPSSSYHVVWFGTNGPIENEEIPGHMQALNVPTGIDGCIIEEGNAANKDMTGHNHMGYGGGAYMVGGSFLRNCIVRRCQATMRGGGIYLDGGGEVENCLVHTCQVTGVAIAQGYGGGVCIDYNGSVKYSYLCQNTARIGGGLSICHTPGEYPGTAISPYQPYATACIVSNNTSNAEAGGIYLDEGGTLNHCTVVKNNCIGPDITYYNRRHGRAGGVYVRNCGMLYNSVMWGNKCRANSDIQFAGIQQASATVTGIDVYYCALYNQDITDWEDVTKNEVYNLEYRNRPSVAGPGLCCWFESNESIQGGDGSGSFADDFKAGVDYDDNTLVPKDIQPVTTWRPYRASGLTKKGVQVSQSFHMNSTWITHAHTSTDLTGNKYELVSTLGALCAEQEARGHALLLPQSREGKADAPGYDEPIPTVFVDPNRDNKSVDPEGTFGDSWEAPFQLLSDAVNYFGQYRITSGENKNKYLIGGVTYPAVQILIKEGRLTTAGEGNYEGDDLRTASIRPKSNMRFYGGYPSELTGTNVEDAENGLRRNPRDYTTLITANVVDNFENNSAHVFALINTENVIIDGVRLYHGNPTGITSTAIVANGAGLILSNNTTAQSDRIAMTGNQLRNCVVGNSKAYDGSAFYINAERPNDAGVVLPASIDIINTIVRNCTGERTLEMEDNNDYSGVIVAKGNATINIDHCTIANNVGYPLKTLKNPAGQEGTINVTNSAFHANSLTAADERTDITTFTATLGTSGQFTGHHNMFDAEANQDAVLASEPTNQWILSVNSADANYPVFKNPSGNVGHSEGADRPLYGGTVNYEPLNQNPLVNAAGDDPSELAKTDRTDYLKFDRGGAADIGAIENVSLPPNGSVIYVTPDGAGRRDGSNWDNAIAGNTVYQLDDVEGPALATGDQLDAENNRVLDPAGNPILTTNDKYCGGFGRSYFSSKKSGGSSTTLVTKTWTIEKNVWDDGDRAGEEEILQDGVVPTVTSETTETSAGVTDDTFVAGYYFDPRYPYGEISGQSRTFWRANPFPNHPSMSAYSGEAAFMNAVDANGYINNTRAEKYVGGLQYAVEKASAYNTLAADSPSRIEGVDSVQVWISNGKYTDYKGFIMRDKTTVMGSFPAVKDGQVKTPGLAERQALMSNVVNIPKAMVAKDFDAVDYETILQISDDNPKTADAYTFNTSVVKFWDDDLVMVETSDTKSFEYKARNIIHHYSREALGETDVTSTYVFKPAFENKFFENPSEPTTENGYKYYVFGTAVSGKDRWHLKYPDKTNYVVSIENDDKTNNKKRKIYNPATNQQLTESTSNWVFLANGSLTDAEFWQTMPNVPQGDYKLMVDMAGGYRNKFSSTDPTNIYFHIIGADGTERITPVMLKTIGSSTGSDGRDDNRNMAYRYELTFEQPSSGSLTIKIRVEDGVRNTTANNATYGTSSGGDPDLIPDYYTTSYGGNNPNRREFWMSNVKLFALAKGDYYLASTDDDTVDKDDVPAAYHEDGAVATAISSTVATRRTTLRKRVLTMPDVTIPTYGAGRPDAPATNNKWGDNVSHTDRVPAGSVRDQRTAATLTKRSDSHYVGYTNVNWDGFTIRHGFLYHELMAHGGGAGVNIYEGANLRNCVIINNIVACERVKGAGIFCDGATSTIEGCFVLNNISTCGSYSGAQNQVFAGGMFMYEGTCFNSLFAKNYSWGSAGGLGFCVGRFYNNTVAYNTCALKEDNKYSGGAISLAVNSNANLFIANTIVYGNNGVAIRDRNTDVNNVNPFLHCYIQSEVAQPYNATKKNVTNWSAEATGNYGIGNIFLNGEAPSATTTPFAADLDEEGNYTGNAKTLDDFRLTTRNTTCVNDGTEEFTAKLLTALKNKGKTESQIKDNFLYKSVEKVVLPAYDVAFANRIQDCSIDIGAYEYDGSVDIKPDTTTFAGMSVYYVTQNGFLRGNASAGSPENAACALKLQKVLDAAGRYKYDLVNHPENHPSELLDNDVIVMLGGNEDGNDFAYTPERSSVARGHKEDNALDYSLIIPHGVQLWGGFYSGTTATPGFYETNAETGEVKMLRNVLRYRTYLSGNVTSVTGATGQAHHVVCFTNDLFNVDETLMEDGNQLTVLTAEKDRAVLDGLIIRDGFANGVPMPDGSVNADQNGAAAVVTSYAHIRNCIIEDNEATGYGGGLYLKPHALVSGTIVKNNEALRGGGIYVEQPAGDVVNDDTYAYILSTTVVGNTASERGGGLYFESNLRANSSAFWHNSATDKNNVSGWHVQKTGESASVATTNYPMVYCGIEVNRWEGVNNLLISASETEGVRWDHSDYYERHYDGHNPATSILYYPIEKSSVLARAGMTYQSYEDYRVKFPTLELTDMAGLQRMGNSVVETEVFPDGTVIRRTKDNALIEMGARVVNASYEVDIDPNYVMKRLYVVHTEDLNSEDARILQDNLYVDDPTGLTDEQKDHVKMYSQMGSCFANPFHRLGDALQYVINVRNSTDPVTIGGQTTTLGEAHRDTRFEIFVTNGTFYPYRNAYGMQAASRSNTFVIPEKVSLVGGVNCVNPYGQEGYGETGTDDDEVTIPVKTASGFSSYTIKTTHTQTIRQSREQSDLNMNNVVEPWELNNQTILSGNVVSGTESKNAYHVVTCYPDETKVGKLPTMYSDAACTVPTDTRTSESRESLAERSIIIDGVTITDGLANDLSDEDKSDKYQQLTYFRGGGILVDGNWNSVFPQTDMTLLDVLGVARRDIPMVVSCSMFEDNMAGNGGAIYSNGTLKIFGCHFAQNSSRGPNTVEDQKYIPWTAGGAIATNYDLDVVNTIFANNEAKRGTMPITLPNVDMADIRQGFGGVISSSETSTVHALNCNFVRNKAVAFPAIYNFLDNDLKRNSTYEHHDHSHYAVNCIFWGNDYDSSITDYTQADGRSLMGELFTVASGKTARKRGDVANFGIEDRKEEVLFFCAYERGQGLDSKLIVKTDDEHGHQKTVVNDWDYYEKGTFVTSRPEDWADTQGQHTHNQMLDVKNEALNGPNFIQPSSVAGIDGYMQNADWLVSRLNRLIDTGWSYLPQHVTSTRKEVAGEDVDVFNTVFKHSNEVANPDGTFTSDEMDNTTLTGSGIYNFYSLAMDDLFGKIGMADLAPLGEHPHMKYDRYGDNSNIGTTMRRISTYPKMGEQEVYIDIGVYEYQYVQLLIPGNAYDVIWVRPDNPSDGTIADGSTWSKATNNVQQAIDMLMSSHNNHDKILKMRAGDYSPVYLTHGQLAFYIERTTNKENILYPTGVSVDGLYGVNSFTIRGGYPNDESNVDIPETGDGHDGEAVRDPERYPVRFIMSEQIGYEDRPEVKANLFVIQNMERQLASKSFISEDLFMTGQVVPVSFEGLTLSNSYAAREENVDDNQNGAAILYTEQTPTGQEEGVIPSVEENLEGGHLGRPGHTPETPGGDGRPKLLIKDCIFLDNSTNIPTGRFPAAAVRVQPGSGDAIIANSLFHSNGGNPLVGTDTKVLNCTFALNGGQLTLSGAGSVLHNSLIWKDAIKNGLPYVFSDGAVLGKANAIAEAGLTGTSTEEDKIKNLDLSVKNTDILNGPNFVDPTPTDPWERDMHPRPSDRVMSRANKDTYKALVPYYNDVPTVSLHKAKVNGVEKETNVQTVTRNIVTNAADKDWTTEKELATVDRFLGKGLERGPYETVAAIQRVLYVNPSSMPSGTTDGATWERAFGEGHMQDALDAAGIYSATNGGKRAFVFVKGDGYTLEEPVQVRDGVTVYGSVTDMHDAVRDGVVVDGDYVFTDKKIYDYINRMRAGRMGIASTTVPSLLQGIKADGTNDLSYGFVLDGFHITNGTTELTESPILLKDDKTLLRNTMIYGNIVKEGKPVVDITQGLLYNSLVYGNDAAAQVRVGSGATGGVLNCTVVGDEAGQAAIHSDVNDHVVNTITYQEADKNLARTGTGDYVTSNEKTGMFAPYLRNGATVYNYPLGRERPYWYQLHELSESVDGGTDAWNTYFGAYASLSEGLSGEGVTAAGQKFIDFTQDRDVLGNPRRLGAHVDMGAFETWRVDNDAAVTVTTATDDADCPVTNYGGHYYPHQGSVTYIGEGASMVVTEGCFTHAENALVPGYLMLKEGGSLYGQGNYIRVPYVAVERSFAADQQYALFSLPYDWKTTNIISVDRNSSTDALVQTKRDDVITKTQTYDGAQRAAWTYEFNESDSPCWTDAGELVANEGYLLTMDATRLPADGTLRFTSWNVTEALAAIDVYDEDGSAKKVTLTQYDEMPVDGSAHFTTNENMGWNLKGMPWLVSDYQTFAIDAGEPDTYQMNVPHLFYNMDKTGNFSTSQSWASTSKLSMGDAYFTQTAIIDDEEDVTFRIPYYATEHPAPARPFISVAFADEETSAFRSDLLEVYPSADEAAELAYHQGNDGIKWMAFDERLPQLFVLSNEGIGMSLVAAAPANTEIPLAVRMPEEGSYVVSLPEPDAFADCEAVWLTDHKTGRVTNLKEGDYTLTTNISEISTDRLTLRFGGIRPQNDSMPTSQCHIYVRGNTLHVEGLNSGDVVRIYTPAGALSKSERAVDTHYQTELAPGVYIVRAANTSKKVLVSR